MIRKLTSILLCAAMMAGLCGQTALAASAQEIMQTVTAVATGSDLTAGDATVDFSAASRTLSSSLGTITVTLDERDTGAGTLQTRTYVFPQDATCVMARMTAKSAIAGQVYSTSIPGEFVAVGWLDGETWVRSESLDDAPQSGVIFIQTTQAEAILYAPAVYAQRENEMIEELTDCGAWLTLTAGTDGMTASWMVSDVPAAAQVECMAVVSAQPLVDWTDLSQAAAWKDLLLTGDNRWTYDGYYYRTPSTYYPTGENYFHRIPDPYITLKMLNVSESYGAAIMSISMLDVMLGLMNEDGYYPTYALSTWLLEDYGIAAGYFDTRWNADMTLGLMTAYDLYGIEEFKTYAVKNGQFWLSHIAAHSTTYTNAAGTISGLLVEDYWHESGSQTTHTSLNHQLAAVLMLYRLGDLTGEASYTDYAEQLLNGICAVGADWIKDDGDLWYRIDPDGTMTGSDYPTLTYDDMVKLQQYLQSKGTGSNVVLTALMASKRIWMDANGVTGYLTLG